MELEYLRNVTTLKLDEALCIGCGMCTEVCPHAVFSIENRKSKIVSKDLCIECGGCAKNCPVNALSVRAGVGCAQAVISSKLGRKSECSCGESESSCCG